MITPVKACARTPPWELSECFLLDVMHLAFDHGQRVVLLFIEEQIHYCHHHPYHQHYQHQLQHDTYMFERSFRQSCMAGSVFPQPSVSAEQGIWWWLFYRWQIVLFNLSALRRIHRFFTQYIIITILITTVMTTRLSPVSAAVSSIMHLPRLPTHSCRRSYRALSFQLAESSLIGPMVNTYIVHLQSASFSFPKMTAFAATSGTRPMLDSKGFHDMVPLFQPQYSGCAFVGVFFENSISAVQLS